MWSFEQAVDASLVGEKEGKGKGKEGEGVWVDHGPSPMYSTILAQKADRSS